MRADVTMEKEREGRVATVAHYFYRPFVSPPSDGGGGGGGGGAVEFEVRIGTEFVTDANVGIIRRQLWGTDEYTEDSDLVAVLQHCGFIRPAPYSPVGFDEIVVDVELKPHDGLTPFPASERNYIRSRAWGGHYRGRRLRILSVWTGFRDNTASRSRLWPSAVLPTSHRPKGTIELGPLTIRKGIAFVFNLSNEPAHAYSLLNIADTTKDAEVWLENRLKTCVLIVETLTDRFELALIDTEENVRNSHPPSPPFFFLCGLSLLPPH